MELATTTTTTTTTATSRRPPHGHEHMHVMEEEDCYLTILPSPETGALMTSDEALQLLARNCAALKNIVENFLARVQNRGLYEIYLLEEYKEFLSIVYVFLNTCPKLCHPFSVVLRDCLGRYVTLYGCQHAKTQSVRMIAARFFAVYYKFLGLDAQRQVAPALIKTIEYAKTSVHKLHLLTSLVEMYTRTEGKLPEDMKKTAICLLQEECEPNQTTSTLVQALTTHLLGNEDWDEAIELQEKEVEKYKTVYGIRHPDTLAQKAELINCMRVVQTMRRKEEGSSDDDACGSSEGSASNNKPRPLTCLGEELYADAKKITKGGLQQFHGLVHSILNYLIVCYAEIPTRTEFQQNRLVELKQELVMLEMLYPAQ